MMIGGLDCMSLTIAEGLQNQRSLLWILTKIELGTVKHSARIKLVPARLIS